MFAARNDRRPHAPDRLEHIDRTAARSAEQLVARDNIRLAKYPNVQLSIDLESTRKGDDTIPSLFFSQQVAAQIIFLN